MSYFGQTLQLDPLKRIIVLGLPDFAACLQLQPIREMSSMLEPPPLFEANPLADPNPPSINPQGVRYALRAATVAAPAW
jgi:hypothetical protein